jgi:hypothetical protein
MGTALPKTTEFMLVSLRFAHDERATVFSGTNQPVCTENLIRVDDVMESPKLAE